MNETVVVILDVSHTMVDNSIEHLEGAIKAVNLFIQQKILFKPKDEIGLVLFGTEETKNNLSDSGYSNIVVEEEICPPTLDLLKRVQRISPSRAEGDFIDALIVGMDMLNNNITRRKKNQRIFLVTNAASPVNKEALDIVLQQFKNMQVKLNVIGIDFSEEEELENLKKTNTKLENEKLLYKIANEVDGVVLQIHRAIEIMSYFRSTPVLQRSLYNGYFEISSHIRIKIKAFTKTRASTFPKLSKLSTVAQEANSGDGTMGVKMERTYHSIDDLDAEVEKDDIVKGYKYGRTIVPFSKVDQDVLKYKCDKCLQLIGFTKASSVPRHHFMGAITEAILPDDTDANAPVGMSAIVRAMVETDSVAIVRYSKRDNFVQLGVLFPVIKADCEFFYYVKLPFSEDIRQYTFAPLDPEKVRPNLVPSKEQLKATEDLINSLDLMTADENDEGEGMEALKPKYTYNPVFQHFYQALQARAINPKAGVPKLDPVIQKYINPDEKMLEKAKDVLDKFKELFPLEKVTEGEKMKRKYWADVTDEIKLDSYANADSDAQALKKKKLEDNEALFSIEKIVAFGITDVGSITPVKDFNDMLNRRDVDLVDKAIEQMKERIQQLVNDSIKDQLYIKAIECLKALRDGCIKEEEAAAFNTFLRLLRSMYEDKKKHDFWQLILKNKISLIHEEECEDSDVTKKESDMFLDVPQKEVVSNHFIAQDNGDEVDELFDMIE